MIENAARPTPSRRLCGIALCLLIVAGVPALAQETPVPDLSGTPMEAPQTAPAIGAAPAPGTRATASQAELLPGVIDSQIHKCWSIPVMTGNPAEGGIARIRVRLLPDGTLAEPPMIIDKPIGALGLVFAESAARAVTKCAPYTLPPELYDSWKDLMLHFDTLDF